MATAAQIASVRRYIYGGSTRSGSLSTDDIGSFVDENVSVLYAAAYAADAEASDAATNPDKKIGDLELRYGAVADSFRTLSASLRAQASRRVSPFAGGISRSAKDTQYADSDMVRPKFRVDQFTNPVSSSTQVF